MQSPDWTLFFQTYVLILEKECGIRENKAKSYFEIVILAYFLLKTKT